MERKSKLHSLNSLQNAIWESVFQVLSEENQRKVVEFCKANRLLLLADEVWFPFPLFVWIWRF